MDCLPPRLNAVIAGCVVLLVISSARAQESSGREVIRNGQESHELWSLRAELFRGGFLGSQPLESASSERSVPLAFVLSAAVPGAGQVYNRDWVKAGVGIGLEAAFWTGYFLWKQEGEDKRDAYRAYAHEHYNPVRYAEWLNTYGGYEGEPIATSEVSDAVDMSDPQSWTADEERMVRRLINEIQAAERRSHFVDGQQAAFSHELPQFGEQQYYELIGKYFQYAPGWDDCGQDCTISDPSDRFFAYAELHGDANTLLRRASRVTALVLINHSLAAIDAAITAQLHNNSVESDLSLRPGPDGRVWAYAGMRLTF